MTNPEKATSMTPKISIEIERLPIAHAHSAIING